MYATDRWVFIFVYDIELKYKCDSIAIDCLLRKGIKMQRTIISDAVKSTLRSDPFLNSEPRQMAAIQQALEPVVVVSTELYEVGKKLAPTLLIDRKRLEGKLWSFKR